MMQRLSARLPGLIPEVIVNDHQYGHGSTQTVPADVIPPRVWPGAHSGMLAI